MFFTARQLEDLHRQGGSNGHVTLPYRARLSPLALDWIRSRKVTLGYSDDAASGKAPGGAGAAKPSAAAPANGTSSSAAPAGAALYWCDGPCGPAKAALAAAAKESPLAPIDLSADPRQTAAAIKALAAAVRAGAAPAGVLVVQNAALATIFANRCPSLRAVVGTSLQAVEQGLRDAAANVLLIEHPNKTLPQVRSLLGRFLRARRELPEELRRQLEELASCG